MTRLWQVEDYKSTHSKNCLSVLAVAVLASVGSVWVVRSSGTGMQKRTSYLYLTSLICVLVLGSCAEMTEVSMSV